METPVSKNLDEIQWLYNYEGGLVTGLSFVTGLSLSCRVILERV